MISERVKQNLKSSSIIRAMFEEGQTLRVQFGAENVYDFSLGNPDPPPPEQVQQALAALVAGNLPGLHGYMSNAGYADVRAKIAARLNQTDGTALSERHIVMTVGAGGGLNVALKALLDPGDEVIVFAPYFVEYRFYIENHGGVIRLVETDSETFLPNMTSLETSITSRTKAIIINSPNNPTGVVYGENILAALAKTIARAEQTYGHAIYVLADEPYRDIVYDGLRTPSVFQYFKNVISVYSYSKSLSLPGERIGYLAVGACTEEPALLLDALIFANRSLGFVNAPSLFQRVVAEALDATVDVDIYRERRDLLYNHLTSLGFKCAKPQGAFYLFPKNPLSDDATLKALALKHHIVLVPGGGFGRPGYFRLAYCVDLETIRRSLPAFTALARELGL